MTDASTMKFDFDDLIYICKNDNELWRVKASSYDRERNYIPASYEKVDDGVLDVKGNSAVTMIIKTDGSLWGMEDGYAYNLTGKRDDRQETFVKIMYGVKIPRQTVKVKINGNTIRFDQPPMIKNGRTLVPLRATFEALGATVTWDNSTQTAEAVKDGITVSIKINDNTLYKNGMAIPLDVSAQLVNNRTLVPVRAVSEAFGCTVDWNDNTQTVIVSN